MMESTTNPKSKKKAIGGKCPMKIRKLYQIEP
jgi:hypothetical protein